MPDFEVINTLQLLWRECQPRILVVTDTLSFTAGVDFGLSQFVATLRASTIHGMTPAVITASHNPGAAPVTYDAATQHITNFKFDEPTRGLLKSRYDVVFLLGFDRQGSPLEVPVTGLDAIAKFMQDGGGVFATGDHEDLGYALAGKVPRVRHMRYWTIGSTPNIANTSRLTTNMAGANDAYDFDDQSDAVPQTLYANFRTIAGGVGAPHPLLQVPGATRAIEVFPDHPHEGECHLPASATTTFTVGGATVPEWPAGTAPESVALTMSHGNAIPTHGKAAVVPRSFMAICAYDGQPVNVGRVATDATWHHFMNVNLTPAGGGVGTGLTGRNLSDVKQYYVNLATWLMPKNTRRCRNFVLIAEKLVKYPLIEEIRWPISLEATGAELRAVGEQVRVALSATQTRAEVADLLADVVELGAGRAMIERLTAEGDSGSKPIEALGLAALGGMVAGITTELRGEVEKRQGDVHALSETLARRWTRGAVKKALPEIRRSLQAIDKALDASE